MKRKNTVFNILKGTNLLKKDEPIEHPEEVNPTENLKKDLKVILEEHDLRMRKKKRKEQMKKETNYT